MILAFAGALVMVLGLAGITPIDRADLLVLAGFVAGAIAMLELVDRLFGGTGIRIDIDEPGGGFGL